MLLDVMLHSNKEIDGGKEKYELQDSGPNTDERHQLYRKLRELTIHGRRGEF